jgi:hypothetical protein
MSGKNKRQMAKFRTNYTKHKSMGEENYSPSKTMPDMHNDPRTVIENHVRGINPINGAILDNQKYYGDAILPYKKDLTYEELRLQREALQQRSNELRTELEQAKATAAETAEPTGTGDTLPKDSGEIPQNS